MVDLEQVSLDNIEQSFPKPWARVSMKDGEPYIEDGEVYLHLSENGKQAMTALLLMHDDCIDTEKAWARKEGGDERGFWCEMSAGGRKFITEHQEHSCVPGLTAEALVGFMQLFVGWCDAVSSDATQFGEAVK